MLIKDDGLRQVIASKLKCKEDEINENNETHKVMLHFKLNIVGYNNGSLNLKDFLLLFSNNERCGSCSI